MAVINYTCITSVSEYSKSIRLLLNELKFLIMVSYNILQPRLHTLLSEYHKHSRYGLQYDLLVLICMQAQVHVLVFTLTHLLRKQLKT